MRVFLSYHTFDRPIALALKRAIEGAVPGADVFVDETHLRHGYFWQPALFEAIAKTDAFLILVSNHVGDWQKYEYYAAQDRKVKEKAFVLLPVIIADRAKGPPANLPGLPQLHWIEGTEPTAPEPLAKIIAALRAPEVAKPPEPPEPWRTINPYRGLLALEEQDADFFFGRERETAAILDRVAAAPGRLIALVGNSGVGKSSLVQAGVIGALKRQRWPGRQQAWPSTLKDSRAWAYLAMKPGEDPIGALTSEFVALRFPAPTATTFKERLDWVELLRQGKARLKDLIEITDTHFGLSLNPPPRYLLYIDQGEELYARTPPDERRCFSKVIADGLASSAQRLIVMTSQRADYYGELQANATLFDLTEKIDVPPLKADGLALVLREPARVLGVGFESDDLVNHMVRAADDEPGALPLLADLFTDLWERMRERGDGTLRVSDRREIIQVGAALAKRADDFLVKNPDKVEAVKRLFTLRLAHVPRQGEPVRARWERESKPGTDPALNSDWALAEVLAGPDWRLTVTGEKDGKVTAEVAHEILLKSWPILQRWLEDERDFLIWRGELDARRKEYDQAGKRDEEAGKVALQKQRQALLMGLPLDTAKKWLAARWGDIESRDRAFIEASVRAELAAARTWRGVQAVVGVLLLGIIASLLVVIYKDEINGVRFEYFTVRPYIAANFKPHVLKVEAERALKRGDLFRECVPKQMDMDYCPDMVVIPAGDFWMGSPDGVGEPEEHPRHNVRFDAQFAVSKFEITWDQWNTCIKLRGCTDRPTNEPGWGEQSYPLINVTWDEANAYIHWLSKVTGKQYRLLTEAEWEYAARGVTGTDKAFQPYPWGNEARHDYANYGSEKCCGGWKEGKDVWNFTAPVGQFSANGFGLYDMHGNVYEWVYDNWHPDYKDAPEDGSAWLGGEEVYHVIRGGSWANSSYEIRSAFRTRASGLVGNQNGFRVARAIAP